jgi:hypothetical protein
MKILLGILGMTAGLAFPLFGQEPRGDSALELAQPKFEAPSIVR